MESPFASERRTTSPAVRYRGDVWVSRGNLPFSNWQGELLTRRFRTAFLKIAPRRLYACLVLDGLSPFGLLVRSPATQSSTTSGVTADMLKWPSTGLMHASTKLLYDARVFGFRSSFPARNWSA